MKSIDKHPFLCATAIVIAVMVVAVIYAGWPAIWTACWFALITFAGFGINAFVYRRIGKTYQPMQNGLPVDLGVTTIAITSSFWLPFGSDELLVAGIMYGVTVIPPFLTKFEKRFRFLS